MSATGRRTPSSGTAQVDRLEPGDSTATPNNVRYRLGFLRRARLLHGDWLDCGCADGSYTRALAREVDSAAGVDVIAERVDEARRMSGSSHGLRFEVAASEELPFEADSFDGVLLNEVFEHVADEARTLDEIHRVLRPGGSVALISPNRWFPFEGHGVAFGRWQWNKPTPIVPWLPSVLTAPILRARNYWPSELVAHVHQAGFEVVECRSVFPVLEAYPWLPARLIPWYRRAVPIIERLPILRKFGVSTLVIGRKRETTVTRLATRRRKRRSTATAETRE